MGRPWPRLDEDEDAPCAPYAGSPAGGFCATDGLIQKCQEPEEKQKLRGYRKSTKIMTTPLRKGSLNNKEKKKISEEMTVEGVLFTPVFITVYFCSRSATPSFFLAHFLSCCSPIINIFFFSRYKIVAN